VDLLASLDQFGASILFISSPSTASVVELLPKQVRLVDEHVYLTCEARRSLQCSVVID